MFRTRGFDPARESALLTTSAHQNAQILQGLISEGEAARLPTTTDLVGARGFDPARESALLTTSAHQNAQILQGWNQKNWSGREDSNLRPPAPHAGALPGCATPRDNGGWNRSRTGVHGFAGRCMTTLPSSQMTLDFEKLRGHVTSTCPLNFSNKIWSGKRDSNSRPRPWQGRALPAELFPR